MKNSQNMTEASDALIIDPGECWVPNKMFLALYIAGIVGMIVLSMSGMLDPQVSTGLFAMTIVYGLLGSLMFFRKISIVRCPSKVLLGAAAFIGVTAFIDKFYI